MYDAMGCWLRVARRVATRRGPAGPVRDADLVEATIDLGLDTAETTFDAWKANRTTEEAWLLTCDDDVGLWIE